MTLAAQAQTPSRGTPIPRLPFSSRAEYARFVAYAGKLTFTSSAGERRKLPIPETKGSVTAAIAPVSDIRRLSHYERRNGAVLARIVADGDYPHMGVKAGTNYVYVDSVPRVGWRTFVIPEKYTATLTPRARSHGDRVRIAKSSLSAGFIPETATAMMTDWSYDPELGCSCGRSSAVQSCH